LSAISYRVLTGVGSVCRECDQFAVPLLIVVEALIQNEPGLTKAGIAQVELTSEIESRRKLSLGKSSGTAHR
jgi:hypothetical protein